MRLSGWRYYAQSIPTLLRQVRPVARVLALFLGKRYHGPVTITLRPSGLQFRVRSAMDVWVIKETCLDRDYERRVALRDGWTIVDIGAGLGDFTAYAAYKNPTGTVIACEPFPESFALLQQNLALNEARNVIARDEAVAAQAGVQALNVDNSHAVQHTTTQAGANAITVNAITLAQLLDDLQVARVDFLKMDIEGAEYPIVLGAAPEILRRIQHIALEYHDHTAAGHHQQLVAHLSALGFAVSVQPNAVHDHLGYLYASRVD